MTDDALRKRGKRPVGGVLSARELEIVKLRYGVGDEHGDTMTLQAIADIYGLSRERIRQLEESALNKLRRHPEVKKLRHLLRD